MDREVRIARSFVESARTHRIDLADVQKDVDLLASRAVIDSLDASSESVSVERDGRFAGEGTVYLSLEYPENVTIGEELPVSFEGEIDAAGAINFRDIRVDLSPFYGSETEG